MVKQGAKKLSHQVAVNAYLLYNNEFLLLKRSKAPYLWGPPGGRLRPDEDPVKGLQREISEETGLKVNIINPVTTWFGRFSGELLLSIDYLAIAEKKTVRLSDEHDNYKWLSIEELTAARAPYLNDKNGFQISDFKTAWELYKYLTSKKP